MSLVANNWISVPFTGPGAGTGLASGSAMITGLIAAPVRRKGSRYTRLKVTVSPGWMGLVYSTSSFPAYSPALLLYTCTPLATLESTSRRPLSGAAEGLVKRIFCTIDPVSRSGVSGP